MSEHVDRDLKRLEAQQLARREHWRGVRTVGFRALVVWIVLILTGVETVIPAPSLLSTLFAFVVVLPLWAAGIAYFVWVLIRYGAKHDW